MAAVLALSSAEKSPCRSAAVGTVAKFTGLPVSRGELAGSESFNPCHANIQKTRFFPLKIFGIHTGPPADRPA